LDDSSELRTDRSVDLFKSADQSSDGERERAESSLCLSRPEVGTSAALRQLILVSKADVLECSMFDVLAIGIVMEGWLLLRG
jgi:hypothetical protein